MQKKTLQCYIARNVDYICRTSVGACKIHVKKIRINYYNIEVICSIYNILNY